MKTLQQEAEEHSRKMWGVYYDDMHPDVAITEPLGKISEKDFIAGANSNYVKRQIIEAQIRVLRKSTYAGYSDLLEELEAQLKELK